MSGLDLFAGIGERPVTSSAFVTLIFNEAAAVGVIHLVVQSIEKYHEANEELEETEQARLAATFQTSTLRVVFKGLSSNLKKYNKDVASKLEKDDKVAMQEILDEIDRVTDTCKGTMRKLRHEIRNRSRNKKELDKCRNELGTTLSLIQSLQTSWIRFVDDYIAMETLVATKPDSDKGKTTSPGVTKRRERKPEPGYIERISTGISGETLVRTDTIRTGSSSTSAGSSFKSTSKASSASTVSLKSLTFTNDKTLREAVQRADLERVKRILKATTDEEEHRASVSAIDQTKEKLRPLHYCAQTGNYEGAKYILGRDQSCVNKPDARDQTALYHACVHHSPNEQLVKILLKQGANFGRRTRPKMDTPSHVAARKMIKNAGM
ncbi:uncharacterized protein KY384_003521 [Bacidia gigantensis]|uniref:uncharacterized protein n=1 Tax=Bacidia gigantensis TaxID=2732470 RepID=UPI001D05B640|nr:uncharacterized protein KY384_003521 [Bacidia gigantensis]KAG8531885.1 hypothetical protein KY384_003521 [Bacidia gigantensis]